MKVKETKEGCWYKGQFIPLWGGLYDNTTMEFFRGALPGLSRTLKCDDSACVCVQLLNDNDMAKVYRIRKLTPKECLRLMGVSDMDILKMQMYPYHELVETPRYSKKELLEGMTEEEKRRLMQKGISDSQLYKMAGNSIVVPVLEGIFTQLFREDNECLF